LNPGKVEFNGLGALQRRFDRAQLRVRCGLDPDRPALVRHYLALGAYVASRGVMPACAVQRRMLDVLLRTAQDEALPWFWRSVCLEHACQPLARVTSLLRRDDPVALAAIRLAHEQAVAQLPATPGAT
jgi:hypothetical protein